MSGVEREQRIELGDFELVLSPGAPLDVFPGRQATRGIVMSTLARHLGDPFAVARVRDAVSDIDPEAARLDDAGLLALVASQVELGRWMLEPRTVEHPPVDPVRVADLATLASDDG